jgi:subtilisin family serine protease
VSIASGGGSLSGTTTINTSSNGQATFTGLAIRGTVGPRTLTFTSADVASGTSGTIDVTAGVPALMTARDGNPQTGPAGGAVVRPPSVTITDADNNRVSGLPVTFQVTSGGGRVDPANPVNTDADGIAALVSWTLGSTAGPNTVSATASGLEGAPVVFSATGLAAAMIRGTITTSNELLAVSGRTRMSAPRLATSSSRRFSLLGSSRDSYLNSGASNGPGIQPTLRSPAYTPDELIVTFRAPALGVAGIGATGLASRATAATTAAAIHAYLAPSFAARGITVTGVSPSILTARIRVRDRAEIARVAAALRADPGIATVERNKLLRRDQVASVSPAIPNDPLYPDQAWNYAVIDAPEAWSITTGSEAVLVAVLDDGIRFDHPAIAPNLSSDGYDFVSNPVQVPLCEGGNTDISGDGNGYDPDPTSPADRDFDSFNECAGPLLQLGNHGLHVAGTIGAAGNDGIGVTGVNWKVRIRPVRVLGVTGSGTDYDIAQGLLYAAGLPADDGAGGVIQVALGAKIINMSLGDAATSQDIENAVIAASNAGSLIIASAGNTGTSKPNYPSAYPEVLSVSAVGPDRVLASYSSFGPTVDIAAPGGDFADGDATFGVGSTSWDFTTSLPAYKYAVGTSMAAPHVAGVAALLLAQNPGLTRTELRSRLTDYAVDAGSPGRDDRYGAGIVNARNSLARNFGPPRQLRARLYDALTGVTLQSAPVAGNGSYSFAVTNGIYQVFAGEDESGDQVIGFPGRRWGALGGAATASRIEVDGPATHQASFRVGFPAEHEPNGLEGNFEDANLLPIGGYLSAETPPENDDNFRVLVPEAGQYSFETSAVEGACGFALDEDTNLGLLHPDGSAVDLNDDIDAKARNFCSRITTTLQPGTYFLRVQGRYGGRYRIQARSGP